MHVYISLSYTYTSILYMYSASDSSAARNGRTLAELQAVSSDTSEQRHRSMNSAGRSAFGTSPNLHGASSLGYVAVTVSEIAGQIIWATKERHMSYGQC